MLPITITKDAQDNALSEKVEFLRLDIDRRLEPIHRAELGQFLTPSSVAKLMAGMFGPMPLSVRLLDPGAGVGSLTAAFVEEACGRTQRPKTIHVVAYEIDPQLIESLSTTLQLCKTKCEQTDIKFSFEILLNNFLESGM